MVLPFVFIVLVAGAGRLYPGQGGRWWRWPVLTAAAGVPALALYGALVPFPTGPERVGVWLGVGYYAAVATWTAFMFTRRRDVVDRAVSHVLDPHVTG